MDGGGNSVEDLDRALLELLAAEEDRVTYYAAWQALRTLVPVPRLRELLANEKSGQIARTSFS